MRHRFISLCVYNVICSELKIYLHNSPWVKKIIGNSKKGKKPRSSPPPHLTRAVNYAPVRSLSTLTRLRLSPARVTPLPQRAPGHEAARAPTDGHPQQQEAHPVPQSSKASVSEEIASGRASVSQRPRAQDDVEGALTRARGEPPGNGGAASLMPEQVLMREFMP